MAEKMSAEERAERWVAAMKVASRARGVVEYSALQESVASEIQAAADDARADERERWAKWCEERAQRWIDSAQGWGGDPMVFESESLRSMAFALRENKP